MKDKKKCILEKDNNESKHKKVISMPKNRKGISMPTSISIIDKDSDKNPLLVGIMSDEDQDSELEEQYAMQKTRKSIKQAIAYEKRKNHVSHTNEH